MRIVQAAGRNGASLQRYLLCAAAAAATDAESVGNHSWTVQELALPYSVHWRCDICGGCRSQLCSQNTYTYAHMHTHTHTGCGNAVWVVENGSACIRDKLSSKGTYEPAKALVFHLGYSVHHFAQLLAQHSIC